MTLTEWRDTLDVLGPDLSAWPKRLADEALELLEVSDEAKSVFVAATEHALSGEAHRRAARPSGCAALPDRAPR